ncbi:hypothetical protein [Streptomyces sp. NPDC048638]|uniref:hypothetical protein n=1 Tax=Streptomyces sp. NPDC048638 TaxID=3365580 RepID=UPI003714BD40
MGGSSVVSIGNVVDLPAPFGPSNATSSPVATSKLTSRTASIVFLPARDVVPTTEPDLPAPPDPVIGLIRRGQADGVFDDQLSAEWIQQVLWGLSYTAFEQVERGTLARFDVAATVIRTLEQGITARSSDRAEPEQRS